MTASTAIGSSALGRTSFEIVLVGLADASAKVSLTMFELCLQKRVTGTYAGSMIPHLDIPGAIDLYLAGRLPLDKLVTQRYAIERLPEGIEQLRQGLSHGRSVVVFPRAA
jgi:S-(hydroxymethyl)glutathione dehydrogenase/alcohol dehydrogenase